MKGDEATLKPNGMKGRRGEWKANGINKEDDRSSVALLDPHEYLYMETFCIFRTKTLLLTHISLVWKGILKSRKP